MIRRCLVAAGVWVGLAGMAASHPHIFVDAEIEVIFDEKSRATALRITWSYDDLFSLMIVEERDMDPDFDGVLTSEETVAIQGFDLGWEQGYAGDTYAMLGVRPLDLSGPSEGVTSYADGRLTSSHLRRFLHPVAVTDQPLVIQVYDPSFYTAYTIVRDAVLTGSSDCAAQTFEPDRTAADRILQDAIAEQVGSSDVEGAFPAIGAAYAEEVRISCASRS